MPIQLSRKYKEDFKSKLIIAGIEVIIGILFFVLPIENIISVMTLIVGIILLISGVLKLLFNYSSNSIYNKYLLSSAIAQILLGLFLVIFRGGVANIVIGSIILAISLFRIILSDNKIKTLNEEIFTLLLALFILLFGIGAIVKVVRYIAGALIILFAIYNLYLAYLEYKKEKNKDNVLDANYKELK